MRLLGIALLGLIVGCGGVTAPVTPPVEPPAGTLYALEPSLKPIPSSALNTRAPTADEFWVGKGKSVTLKISAKQLSPLTRKVRITFAPSGASLSVTIAGGECIFDQVGQCTLENGQQIILTILLDSSISEENIPYFYVYGDPLDANGNTFGDRIRYDYRWNLAKPPIIP